MSLRNKPISCPGADWLYRRTGLDHLRGHSASGTFPFARFHWPLTEVHGMTHWIWAFWLMTLKPALFQKRLVNKVRVKIKEKGNR